MNKIDNITMNSIFEQAEKNRYGDSRDSRIIYI